MSKYQILVTVEFEPNDEISSSDIISGMGRSLNYSIGNGLLTNGNEELVIEQYSAEVTRVTTEDLG